jgi:hypothetical protein
LVHYVKLPRQHSGICGRYDFVACDGCSFECRDDYVRIACYDRNPSWYAGGLMMPIDTTALRKFQDVWGPVLAAIPAVLEATAQKADVERELRIKQAEIDEADKKIAKAFEEADKRLSSVNSEMEQAMQQKAKALADIEAAKKVDADNRAKANEVQRKAADDWNVKIATLQSQFSNVEAEHAKKVSAAEADFAAKTAALEADVKDLEKRKAAAEKALDALRSKLG